MPRCNDPARTALPVSAWPAGDRHAWDDAITHGDPLDEEGPAAHWATKTKQTNIQHYGRWLGWLQWRGRLDTACVPAARVTREAVGAYNQHLVTIVAPITRLSMLVGLKVMMQAMAPHVSWRWLQETCNRVQRGAKPAGDKARRVRETPKIYAAALAELARLPQPVTTLTDAVAYRDAFMLALLAMRPLRVKNFSVLALDHHLHQIDDAWLITVPAVETKTHQPIEFYAPAPLVPWLDRYLAEVRPLFPDASTSQRLWLNQYGPHTGRGFVYRRLVRLTKRLLGAALNPHLLRDCAASSLAMESVDLAQAAAPLLGHRHFSTTERYYIQANNLDASRRLNGILGKLKAELGDAV